MREANYTNIGLQLKKIRDQLDWTLDIMCKATGISRSYLSEKVSWTPKNFCFVV